MIFDVSIASVHAEKRSPIIKSLLALGPDCLDCITRYREDDKFPLRETHFVDLGWWFCCTPGSGKNNKNAKDINWFVWCLSGQPDHHGSPHHA